MKHLYEYLQFSELSDEAASNAIEKIRQERYEDSYICEWAIDDSELFEPPHEEMAELFGENYYAGNGNEFMLENTKPKSISFVGKQDQNHYLHCSKSIDVTNNNLFYRWLGIPARFHKYIYYTFGDGYSRSNTGIDFQMDDHQEFDEKFGENGETILAEYFEKAEKKFDSHMDYVLTKISSCIDSQYEDDAIIDHIESNEITFDGDGNPIR
jgi:3',5'-cyclic AMP phosphodiesterase CpdA